MGLYNPPNKAEAFKFYVGLVDAGDPLTFKINPTIASGDFKISKDGGAFANLTNLPAVVPAGGVQVEISLTSTEMTADNVTLLAVDQTAGKEWADFYLSILTT